MQPTRIVFAAASAMRARAGRADFFITAHAQRTGALEHVKQFAEGNVEQQGDHANHVNDGPQAVAAAFEKLVAHCESHACDGDREDDHILKNSFYTGRH